MTQQEWVMAIQKRTYVRQTKEIPAKEFKFVIDKPPPVSAYDIVDYRGYVLFCGRFYPYWEINEKCRYSFKAILKGLREPPVGYYNYADDEREVRKRRVKIAKQLESRKSSRHPILYRTTLLTEKSLREFRENVSLADTEEILRKYHTPVIHFRDRKTVKTNLIEINPRLNKLNFQSVVDPYTAFQEIEMFVGSQLAVQRDPEVHVSDEIKAESHGFNKWSFRRPPKK